MSLSRYAPHQIRARYQRALSALPIPAASAAGIDPKRLTILGATSIAERQIIFGTLADAPRLWLAFNDTEPDLIGYMTGLVVGEPDLWISDPAHQAWALEGDNTTLLKCAAARVWFACLRDCEG
ncbi:hypothetical protein L0U85_14290 [Glycomyces sp. L485]|uniref:hypothetical protein n=1 Tax=Glycomyces sp. L485 TaxID=2909235 RepID=UPI001F4AFABB|nr:hypothetical protein [Glycomyces sp. L485]MCH7232016.1 hypothetical protein [Glycomyces sp. L485]